MALNFLNDGYFAGKVGIGKPVPTKPLDVVGNAQVEGTLTVKTANNNIRLLDSNDNTVNFSVGVNGRFQVRDVNGGTSPFQIEKAAPNDSLFIKANSNVGIGTDSPNDALEVKGDNSTQHRIRINNAGTGTSTLAFVKDTTFKSWVEYDNSTGNFDVWQYTNNPLRFATNNTERMRISSAGNVGIGTTIPSAKLHVQGSSGGSSLLLIRDTNSTLGTKLATFIQQDGTNNPNLDISSTSTGILVNTGFSTGIPGSFTLQSNGGNSYLAFNTSSANERMRINSVGNVGIGTTTPTAPLHIEGGTNSEVLKIEADSNPFVRWVENGTDVGFLQFLGDNAYLSNMSNGSFFFRTNNTDKMTILAGGNVGIGTTSPSAPLEIAGAASASDTGITIKNGSATRLRLFHDDNGGSSYLTSYRGVGAAQRLIIESGNDLNLSGGGGSAHMVIKTSGNVGIGTTSPGAKLEISHGGANNGLLLENTLNSSNYQIALNIRQNEGLIFQRWIGGIFNGNLMRIGYTGGIKFDAYDGTNNTGTATFLLGTDANGNVIKTTTVPSGSGGPFLPLAGGTLTGLLKIIPGTANNTSYDALVLTGGANSTSGSGAKMYLTGTVNDPLARGTIIEGLMTDNANAHALIFSTSAASSAPAERMRIISTGNVGIGTSTPDNISSTGTVLSISTQGALTTNSLAGSLTFLTNDASFTNTYVDGVTTEISSICESTTGAAYGLSFSTSTITSSNRAERLRITATGNVGIGTTNPSRKFVVSNGGASGIEIEPNYVTGVNEILSFNRSSSVYEAMRLNGGSFEFQINGSEKMRILANGNVGIGTTSPTEKLDISGTAIVRSTLFTVGNVHGFNPSFGASFFINNSGGTSYFNTTGGNVGIGTTSPTAKLHVAGTGLFTGLVSGITPVNLQLTLLLKHMLMDQVGGTGPFLPLAGGTMTGTNGVVFPDDFKLNLGAGSDLQIYHGGVNSHIDQNGSGDLYIKNTRADGDIFFQGDDGTGSAVANYFLINGGGQETRFQKNTRHNDNVLAQFGNGDDLQIYHDGSNSYITDEGTGILNIRSSNSIKLRTQANEDYLIATEGGSVELYYDNLKKFETTSTGVDVTGALSTTTNVSVGNNAFFVDNGKALFGAAYDLQIFHDGSDSYINETGTGSLYLKSAISLVLSNITSGSVWIECINNQCRINFKTQVQQNLQLQVQV